MIRRVVRLLTQTSCAPPQTDRRSRRARLSVEALEDRSLPTTLIYNNTFDWGGVALVTATVTEDAPGYEGLYLWNYHVVNVNYMSGAEDIGLFALDVPDPDAVANIGNNMGWVGAVGQAGSTGQFGSFGELPGAPSQVFWQADEFADLIGIGQAGDFWFTTLSTGVVNTTAIVADRLLTGEADGLAVAPAPALIVDTHLDVVDANDGLFSLREAVIYVNGPDNLAGFFHVRFKPELDGQTITLDPMRGQLPLTKDIFIDGPANKITVQRDPGTAVKHRIFEVAQGVTAKIARLSLRNGFPHVAGGALGGAILSAGPLTVEDCYFAQNQASAGGGIAIVNKSSLTITGSTFTGNAALSASGGAIFVDFESTATISNSSIVLNTADMFGGGIYINSSTSANPTTVTLHAVDVNGNRADFAGGGIYVNRFQAGAGTTLTLKGGTTIQNNLVTSSGGQGGGIYFGMGTINLNGVSFGGNEATQGDGMYRAAGTTMNIGILGVAWNGDGLFEE